MNFECVITWYCLSIKNNAVWVFHSRDNMSIKSCSTLLYTQLLGTRIKNLNRDCLLIIVQSHNKQTMWSSSTGILQYTTEHLVKTSDNLSKSIDLSPYSLTGIYDGITYSIGPLCVYFILRQILKLPTYSLTS